MVGQGERGRNGRDREANMKEENEVSLQARNDLYAY